MTNRIYVSHPLNGATPTYGNRDKLQITPKSQILDGIGANTSSLVFSK